MSEFAMAQTGKDVRQLGFATRAAFAMALSWIEQHVQALGPESIPAASATHRILAVPVRSRVDQPDVDRAACDGHAVQASDTEAADSYTPLLLRLADGNTAWRPSDARTVAAGTPMPPGTNAVLPFEATTRHDGMLAVMAPVAPGSGVRLQGADTWAGQEHLATGRQIRPEDPAFLMALGVTAVDVVRQPRVAVLSIGPKNGGADLLGPMLLPRIARDGGRGLAVPSSATIAQTAAGADLVIVAGRSGSGADDDAAPTLLAEGGVLALHGVALRPGESTGLGQFQGTPVLLLPGEPLACLAA
jgi:molybdopterin molybdotransferase